MKDIKQEFIYNKEKYSLVFNLNVMEDLQKKYGSIEEWLKKVSSKHWQDIDMGALKYALTLMINEGIDIENEKLSSIDKKPFFSERQVGRMITNELISQFNKTIEESTKIDNLPKNE